MHSTRLLPLAGLSLVLLAATASPLLAQEAVSPSGLPSTEELGELLARKSSEGEGVREDEVGLHESALVKHASALALEERFAALEIELAQTDALLESVRTDLELARATEPGDLDLEAPLADLDSQLSLARAELASAQTSVEDLDQLASMRTRRLTEIPEELVTAQQAVRKHLEDLQALPGGAEYELARLHLLTEVAEQRALQAVLEKEREVYEARRELLPLRTERAQQRLVRAQTAVNLLQNRVSEVRADAADATALEVDRALAEITSVHPVLIGRAERVRELANLRSGEDGLPRRIALAQEGLLESKALLEEVNARFSAVQRRINAGGLTESMGILLRRDYGWLPLAGVLHSNVSQHEDKLSEAQLEHITIEEALSSLQRMQSATRRVLGELGVEAPDADLRAATRELLTLEKQVLESVRTDTRALTSAFYSHKELDEQLVRAVAGYRSFIQERILWVRSSALPVLQSFTGLTLHLTEFSSAWFTTNWMDEIKSGAKNRQAWFGVLLLATLLLVASQRFISRKRAEMGALVRSYKTDRYLYTVRAMVQTVLLALPLPLATWTLGWLLVDSVDPLAHSVGGALKSAAYLWLALRVIHGLVHEKGVGQLHFRWPSGRVESLRAELRWYEPVSVVLGFFTFLFAEPDLSDWSDSIGRLFFVMHMVGLFAVLSRLLRVGGTFWSKPGTAPDSSLIAKANRAWSWAARFLPLGLAGLAMLGYFYTAEQFELRFRYSILFAFAIILVHSLLLRWLFMTRRQLAVDQALETRARKQEEENEGPDAADSAAQFDSDQVDIPAVDAQTRRLFRSSITLATMVGLFLIWASVFPALRRLDQIQIYPAISVLSAADEVQSGLEEQPEVSQASSEVSAAPLKSIVPGVPMADATADKSALPASITLADILLALVVIVATTLAAKNLPAFLELALLQRLPLDGGARYAVSTIVRYLILLLGVSLVSSAVGIGWQQIQWLAAALTFGLAFGLQEIFANFVSGLIILLERPIRVGDIVTVGETEGRVTQLRMRATTIQDYDQRELLVPNKEFITGSVINWTLTDPVTRVIIPVGIAYGSDTQKARRTLMRVGKANPLVLDDPAPGVVFRQFGDSTLNFELRAFIPSRERWAEVLNALHMEVDAAFRKEGIEIAFPQRDLHIRSGHHPEAEESPPQASTK